MTQFDAQDYPANEMGWVWVDDEVPAAFLLAAGKNVGLEINTHYGVDAAFYEDVAEIEDGGREYTFSKGQQVFNGTSYTVDLVYRLSDLIKSSPNMSIEEAEQILERLREASNEIWRKHNRWYAPNELS